MKTVKTGSRNRVTYSYVDVMGKKCTLHPGDVDPKTGETITGEWIAMLHRMDDNEVYNNVKNTRVPIQKWERPIIETWKAEHPNDLLPSRMHISIDLTAEKDETTQGYIDKASLAVMDRQEDALCELLHEAVDMLDPERRELYRRIVENEENTKDVAKEFGVDSSAIRHRMATIRKQIEKNLKRI